MIRYLCRRDVEALALAPAAIADAIEAALGAAAEGCATNFPKTTLARADGGLWQSTLAGGTADPAPPYTAVKVLGLSPHNRSAGLPHMGSVIVLLARDTGLPAAILEAGWITDFRTAALTLVAARRLARKQARRLGLVACGAQARAHLITLASAFPLEVITAWGRRDTAAIFADWARSRGFDVTVASEPGQAVRDQDIVVTSVPAGADQSPMLEAEWLAPGSFASLVDLGRSWHERGFDGFALRFTDDRAQAGKPGARRLVPAGPYTGDLMELVTGRVPGRTSDDARAIFTFQGLSLADLAAAALVHEAAEAAGVGTLLER